MRKIFEVALEASPLCHMWVKLCGELLNSHKRHSQVYLGVMLHEAQYRFSVGSAAQSAVQSGIATRHRALMRKARGMRGLCRYLGLLYMSSLLPEAFMHECLKHLLKWKDVVADLSAAEVVCVCELLATAGTKLRV